MIVALSFKIKFIPTKIHKTVATRAAPFDPDMHQIVCRLGLRPRPHWGSLQRSPVPPSWIKGGLLLRGGEGRRGRGGDRKGGGKGKGRGKEEGDGRTNPKPAATGLY